MNVDLRKTLSHEKGKEVDYLVSELRTMELLEELCPGMQHYGVTEQEDGTASFQRHSVGGGSVHITGTMKIGTKKYHDDRLKLQSYCEGLVEEHEELLGEAVKKAGLVQLQKRQEEKRIADRKRKGDTCDDDDEQSPYAVLGLPEDASREEAKAAYRRLSRELHPDKTGGDPAALKRFVAVANAYEKATGAAHQPYEDLYRQVCVDIVGVCKDEAEVDQVKSYFPKYYNSLRFQRPDDDASNKLPPSPSSSDGKRRRRRQKKKATKKKSASSSSTAAASVGSSSSQEI